MSEWITPTTEDIDLTEDGKEVHIYIESDQNGNRYISIEGKVLDFLKKILKWNALDSDNKAWKR